MTTSKCDICKKKISINGGTIRVDVFHFDNIFYERVELCFDCGGTIKKFLKSKKLLKDKVKQGH